MSIKIGSIITFINCVPLENYDNNLLVTPGSLKNKSKNKFYWLKNIQYYKYFEEGFLILSNKDYKNLKTVNKNLKHILTKEKRPRLMFSEILNTFFFDESEYYINDVKKHLKNKNIYIGSNVFIGTNVTIGNKTRILNNCVINKDTTIGKNCLIKENSTIGTEGLGYEFDNSEWIKFPQIGGVIIKDNVTFGPNSTIRRAALDNTIIGKGCKIGAFVNIGHNCIIGKNAMLTCQCVIGGSTKTGNNLFMGIQSSIRNGLIIANNITIGQGGIVTKNILEDNVTYIGNPAEPLENYKKWSLLKKQLKSKKS